MANVVAYSDTATRSSFWRLAAAPFLAVGRLLVHLAETSPRIREIERLNSLSDEDLARRGLTRDGEIRRILGVSALI